MAGNKINAKSKGKDDRSKGSIKSNNDETEDKDFSLLRKPIQTSVTGFAQARKIFDMATEELKGLLSDECDLLYECKVCRNLFRSLVNFISHKRVYCQNKFNSTVHGHFMKSSSALYEFTKIKLIEEGYQDSLKEGNKSENIDEVDERIPITKDLTTIVEKIAKNKGISECMDKVYDVALHKIQNSTVAVFQNMKTEEKEGENMRTQVNELDEILSRNIAILQNDGKFKIDNCIPKVKPEAISEGVIQISDDEESGNADSPKCKICDMQFATQKTLKFHMKYKHLDTRVVYPCPDCLEIFSTSWSVYRHLFKVHRKTAAQIRRLRESIQAKAFKMNNPPAFYEKRKNNMKAAQVPKITEEERLDQENQAWIDNMECDGEVPRCGGCGRTFERRAALAAHTHTCQPRSRALRRPEGKRIEIQIRKDYNKGPTTSIALPTKADVNENKIVKETKDLKEIKEVDNVNVKPNREPEIEEVTEGSGVDEEVSRDSGMQLGDDEAAFKSPSVSPEKMENAVLNPEPQTVKLVRLPFAQHAEKSNLMALRQRIIPDIELNTLRCKKCDTRCIHIQELYDHVAKHYNWMRYACKLCNFKHYNFEKLPEHVKIVHKLKGDKDFYFSTVKAIEGAEATELATPIDEPAEVDESPTSRRPSRCSSDSSRLSDDSSTSNTRVEGSRKRKMIHKARECKMIGKRRKSFKGSKEPDEEWADKDDSQSNIKTFEENSSDLEDAYEKVDKKRVEILPSVASRRPVRRKAKPKNEDFEYDLSNLLKMEAQGYRDSQTVSTTTKTNQTKKKIQLDSLSNYEMLIKECCGALVSDSRKSVENAKAHMKTEATLFIQKEKVPPSIFVRPMLPKTLNKGDKLSPKKEAEEMLVKGASSSTSKEITKESTPTRDEKDITENNTITEKDVPTTITETSNKNVDSIVEQSDAVIINGNTTSTAQNNDSNELNKITSEKAKHKSITIPPVVPIKFRRQSMEVIKSNPILNKYSSEFSKAGMKTKILVIKPIHRNKDGIKAANPLKFQTIKLKETNKKSSIEDQPSDQVVVVKVPKVDCIARSVTDIGTKITCKQISLIKRTERTPSAPDELPVEKDQSLSESSSIGIINLEDDVDIDTKKPEPDVERSDAKKELDENNSPSIIATCDNQSTNIEDVIKNDLDSMSNIPSNDNEEIVHSVDLA